MLHNPYKPYFGSLYGSTIEDFIANTTLIKKREEVKPFLHNFFWKVQKNKHTNKQVIDFIAFLIKRNSIHSNIHIVTLTSWRKNVIQIYPNKIMVGQEELLDFEYQVENFLSRYGIIFLYLNETVQNPYLNPSCACNQESENLSYFLELKKGWKSEYLSMKKEVIDGLLDEYNFLKNLYDTTCDQIFLDEANKKLEEMKNL